ncbi:venom carboxylesterase-6-like [Colletes gigas]|uniref:venom carboxylesterase-6-like n=1 Tax=Colletes gigas TaxID=935657 RepID=UPI001C9A8B13|nr:venom carboxylesterase-6-like [Colletes gigas]XP_043262700.1 venom carboxylesterase-6-like [Colletes gigas]
MMRQWSLLWLVVGCIYLLELSAAEVHVPSVKIKNGTLSGQIMKTRRGREFAGFRGIPYALPPLGEHRFEPPRPSAAWNGVRSAQDDANICTQRNIYTYQDEIIGDEDCLYLNVYTPKLPKEDDGVKGGYPVMIWLHGCGWICGAGHSDFYSPKFLLDHDVILVTANYRLGPLGFLSTEDTVCPGNNGLKDQAQSIRWVHENIAAFGGDPNRVTIFGESAGGASVHYHMMSNLTKGMFHRAISQSGNGYCPWAVMRPGAAKKNAEKVADLLDCPSKDSKQLVACLRNKKAVDIIGTDRAFQEFGYCPMIPFRPVIEPIHPGAVLTEDPAVASRNGRLLDIPWMTGITSEEGSIVVPGLYTRHNGKLIKKLNDDFVNIAPVTLLFGQTCPKAEVTQVASKIREFYFGKAPIDNSTRFNLIDMYSDAWFTHAAHTSVRDYLEKQSSPVYYYYLAYRGSASFSIIFGDPSNNYGVSHADELQYLFPVGEQLFKDIPLSEKDQEMVDVITSMWFNFANSGNPTPEVSKEVPLKWKPVRTRALEYLRLGQDDIKMSENLISDRMNFWNRLPIRPDLDDGDKRQQKKDEL